MTFFGWARQCAVAAALCVALCGCFPPADNQSDETKEPHFIAGKNLVEQMDWQGAVDEFQKSLEVNPRSAAAHFELGWLTDEKLNPPDPAAAIYHFEQFLNLNPGSDKADLVKQRISNCKLELVKNMSAGPIPSGAQKESDRLAAENRDLQTQVAQLQAQIAQLKAALASRPPPTDTGTPIQTTRSATQRTSGESARTDNPRLANTSNNSTHIAASGSRSHTVKSHETMASIARQYGISLASLEGANPQVRPTRLLVGQTLKIPAP